jgi:hypothetical protein
VGGAARQRGVLKKVGAIHLILLAGLIHGLLYVLLLPPWQHYDEPGHFEFAWLIANRPGLPSAGEYDQGMRREVAASMVEHSFFKDLNIQPNLLDQYTPIWIGISQTDNPPIYYWITSLPLRLVPTSDITFQLYLCRLVSLVFYLLTILAAYGVLSELTAPGNPARWLIPATLVLLPGFTDLMTAVNSDVGAVAFFSLFLWACLRMIQRGFKLTRLVTTGLLAAACFWTKNTAAIALPLLVIPILFSLLRERRQWIAWILLGVGIPIGIFFVFTSGDVAFWYQPIPQNTPTRVASTQAPLGSFVFQIDASSGVMSNNLIQLLSSSQVERFRGQKVTLGYWIWANQPVKFHSPLLRSDQQTYSTSVEITTIPTFHTYTTKIAGNTRHLQIVLDAPSKPGLFIYLDGLVLMKGDYSQRGKPAMSDAGAQHGIWAGKSFVNPIRNASAEQDWPHPRTLVQNLLSKVSPLQPNMVLASLADWQNSRWYYRTTAKQLVRTFWGQFGWGHIRLSRNIYIGLSILTVIGALGGLVRFWRNRTNIPWAAFALLAVAVLGIWGAALVRGIHSIAGSVFIPSARYAYPAIIPTVWLLCAGWAEWPRLFERWLRIPRWVKIAVFLASFLLLDMLSIWTIARFYGKL